MTNAIYLDPRQYPIKTTQKERYEQAKKVIYSYPQFTKFYRNTKQYHYLHLLMQNYPDYKDIIGCGVKYFEIKLNRNNSPHVTFIRFDGNEDSFSWVSASKLNFKPENCFDNLCQAMRYSVTAHTSQAKCELLKKDPYCKICKCDGKLELDHIEAFYNLQSQFFRICKKHHIEIPERFDRMYDPNNGKIRTIPAEFQKFEKNWIKYHNRFARYQLLCKTCNIRKGKR